MLEEQERLETVERFMEERRKELGATFTMDELSVTNCPPWLPKPWTWGLTQITRDSIRHFVDAIGDLNPIYRDEEYARGTRYGGTIAPPTHLYSILWGMPSRKHVDPRLQPYYAGDEWEFFEPLRPGEEPKYRTVYPTRIEVKESRFAKSVNTSKVGIEYGRHEFIGRAGKLLATDAFWLRWVARRFEERNAPGEYRPFEWPEYSEEYLARVYAAQDNEIVRGVAPRYWEDVAVGEELPSVVRGPYTMSEAIAWVVAIGSSATCSDRLLRLYDGLPEGKRIYDPVSKLKQSGSLVHFDSEFARRVLGAPGAYDFAAQRASWLAMVITNWMGDDGFLWKFRVEVRGWGLYGDTTWCKAKVGSKYHENGRACVDLEGHAENQRGEVIMPAKATVILPSREKGPVVYPAIS